MNNKSNHCWAAFELPLRPFRILVVTPSFRRFRGLFSLRMLSARVACGVGLGFSCKLILLLPFDFLIFFFLLAADARLKACRTNYRSYYSRVLLITKLYNSYILSYSSRANVIGHHLVTVVWLVAREQHLVETWQSNCEARRAICEHV